MGPIILRTVSDIGAAWDWSCWRARPVCRCKPACARLPCSDEKIHAEPGRSAVRIREYIGRENQGDASAARRDQLRLCATESDEKSRVVPSRSGTDVQPARSPG